MDGRRHSVDVPITKAIGALRRVRSLRDPCTNSMPKFSALPHHLNWDTDSLNAISLRFDALVASSNPLPGGDDEVVADSDKRSVGCCWPTFSDEDSYPLLSGDSNELVPRAETPRRSLSLKFKPKSFSDLVGQNVVASSLSGAISKGRIASLYLFHGPHGNGKTCAATIFAAALNCLSLEQHRPCGLCQECLLYFAGRSRDATHVDSLRINSTNRLRSLLKNAAIPPLSSRFKVFLVDDCQFLRLETWASLLNTLHSLPPHSVFIMVTSDIDKVPRSAVARSQTYRFPKIKDVDISSRLYKICIQEGLEFEQLALDFIAAKSNGSLRDAEMMLDQLSLLSKPITVTSASELIGIVSDDELLILLDLALSADTSNTVKRARELMHSRIDPMQLLSQLANIIMDILAGKLEEETSQVKRSFLQQHSSEMDLRKLCHALKILSESEKQLRASKNQTTWLTVALLQLNSFNSSLSDPYEPQLSLKATNSRDVDCCSTSSPGDCVCDRDRDRMHQPGTGEHRKTLEAIWMKATELCESNSLSRFLRKRGKLSAVYVKKGLAVAELDFSHPDYASKAEKSWKLIASTLQRVLGQNVELRINSTSIASHAKARRPSFSFFSCSRRMYKSKTDCGGDQSDCSNDTSSKAGTEEKIIDVSLSYPGCGSHIHQRLVTTIRNSDGNTLSTGTGTPHRFSHDGTVSETPHLGSQEQHVGVHRSNTFAVQEPEHIQQCLSNTRMVNDGSATSDQAKMVCGKRQPQDNIVPSPFHGETSFDAYICSEYPYILCNGSKNDTSDSKHDERSAVDSQVHCWRTPQVPINKGWQAKNQRPKSQLVEWVLPCAAAAAK